MNEKQLKNLRTRRHNVAVEADRLQKLMLQLSIADYDKLEPALIKMSDAYFEIASFYHEKFMAQRG